MKVIVGLGNPGAQYAGTRHNVGFMTIDALARNLRAEGPAHEALGLVFRATTPNGILILAKPQTFVNLSGQCAARLLEAAGCGPEGLLVVCDDLALPLGTLRARPRGGTGGHKGLASIEAALGTQEYARLRVGIGPLPEGVVAKDFVLDVFRQEEIETIQEAIARAAEAAQVWASEGIEACMNRFN